LKQRVILLGASTGGPSQIKELLKEIKNLSSTIIINQHMKEEVLPFFIKDIHSSCNFEVLATPLKFSMKTPCVIICSHSSTIEKEGEDYIIKTETEKQYYTPDINQFFNSFSNYSHLFNTEVLIMTGIGNDGIEGASLLKKLGAKVYAQDEKSSPVYGMPKAVLERNIVDQVMSFDALKSYFKSL